MYYVRVYNAYPSGTVDRDVQRNNIWIEVRNGKKTKKIKKNYYNAQNPTRLRRNFLEHWLAGPGDLYYIYMYKNNCF